MIGLSYEQIIDKIKNEKGLSQSEIEIKIKKKLEQLSDLISKEGAAYIIANELGIKLFDKLQKRFKINMLSSMLRNIEVAAKVVKLYEIRSFKTSKKEGRLAALLVGDETASIRAVVWDEPLIKKIESNEIKEGDVIVIKNAYVRDNNGFKELHLGSGSSIDVNPEGVEVILGEAKKQMLSFERKKIAELKDGDTASLYGTVVQLFEPRFYEACPECGKKLEQEKGKLVCKEHNIVGSASIVPIVSFFLDDGSDNIRVVCFRENAEKALGVSSEAIVELKGNPSKFQDMRGNILGDQFVVNGRAKMNGMFNRLEFNAIAIESADPEKIIESLSK